jgi:hypothetical protein
VTRSAFAETAVRRTDLRHVRLPEPVATELVDRDGPVERDRLTRAVASRVTEAADEATLRRSLHRVHLPKLAEATLRGSLHRVHLPKLAEAGLVAYDTDEAVVAYEGHPELPPEPL